MQNTKITPIVQMPEFVIIRNELIKSLYDVVEVDYEQGSFVYVAKAQSFEDAQDIFEACTVEQQSVV